MNKCPDDDEKANQLPEFGNDVVQMIVQGVRRRPLSILREFQKRYVKSDAGFHRTLQAALVVAYEFALLVQKSSRVRKQFFSEDFFSRCRRTLRKENALRLTMKYIVDAHEGPRYKRSNVYATALQRYFDRGDASERIAKLLGKKGVQELYYKEVERRRQEKTHGEVSAETPAVVGQGEQASDKRFEVDSLDEESVEEMMTQRKKAAPSNDRRVSKILRPPELRSERRYLYIEVKHDFFMRAMNLDEDESLELVIETPEPHAEGQFMRLTGKPFDRHEKRSGGN